jgi:hypothetical protein
MCCFGLFRRFKPRKIRLNSGEDNIQHEVILVSVMYKIRSFSPLTKEELDFVKKLPKDKIDEIIDNYNSHAFTVMDIYEPELNTCGQGINFSQRC